MCARQIKPVVGNVGRILRILVCVPVSNIFNYEDAQENAEDFWAQRAKFLLNGISRFERDGPGANPAACPL